MFTVINKKNILITILILSFYSIFIIILWDIFRVEKFLIGTKGLIALLFFLILFIWAFIKFLTYKYILSNKNIISILLSSILFSLLLQNIIHSSKNLNEKEVKTLLPKNSTKTSKFSNPLYKEFQEISNKYNLDLSFTKDVWIQRGPSNLKINPIYGEKPHSLDIIFFGDSSIAWGLIPQVIEQMTNKKVGIVAYSSTLMNIETTKIFDMFSKYYLKKDGILIFSFDDWTLVKDSYNPPTRLTSQTEMYKWSYEKFSNFCKSNQFNHPAKKDKKHNQIGTPPKKNKKNYYQKYLSFSAFTSLYKQTSSYLTYKHNLSLKSLLFYKNYIEPRTNPALYAKKIQNTNIKTKFLRWDMHTTTEYNPNFIKKSIHSNVMPGNTKIYKHVTRNAKYASEIYGNTKIYMVPLFDNDEQYLGSRNLYYKYYKNVGFKLCDLGEFQPIEDAYTLQGNCHMGNTGGLMKSILIAKWLNIYYKNNK